MIQKLTTIGFDADDTLWQNERFFQLTQDRFAELLADHTDPDHLMDRLLDAEKRNIGHYGFGIKGFVLSMIETALDVTNNQVPGHVIRELVEVGQDMLHHPIDLLPHAEDTVVTLAKTHQVVLITKGDLLDQERKLAKSGLGDLFHGVEIVSDKIPPVYTEIFAKHGEGAGRGLMAGNSMKSDVLPMIDAGGWGVYVPHGQIWELERADPPKGTARYHNIPDLSELPAIVDQIEGN